MKIINRFYLFLGFFLVIFISLLILLWMIANFIKIVDVSSYNYLRDEIRVFRTEYLRPSQKYRFTELHPEFANVDVNSIIRVIDIQSSNISRRKLLDVIWNNANDRHKLLPNNYVNISENANHFIKKIDKDNLIKQIEEIQFVSKDSFFSKSYHFIPKKQNGSLILFHSGNTGSFLKYMKSIKIFLEEGYDVLAFSMWIIDKQPEISVNGSGVIKFRDHSFLKFISEPLRIYFDPVVAGLNYLTKNNDYEKIIAVGFSGGGWVITVLSAFDQRIKLSYPIAGSYPLYLRRFRDWSTWQETFPPLLKAANYLDLYLMSSEGQERRQVQILNKYDGCCYSGIGWTTYASIIRDISKNLGGNGWDIFIDDSHADHKISNDAIEFILNDINKYK
ncbi:MAG: hypothetical protein CFH01_01990 [Alphaproteobacteria bacterium MarineAlpha2_Bin1]|nr:MAG: hypothetical protein CFH01_01990 [Alphaproteobacteria bacterium MarineAlpha2_Bin1]